jgi:SPP1 family predicted phage head-tail adaptor
MSNVIGALRARVKLQGPVRVADEIGGAAILWSDVAEVWAAVDVLSARQVALYDAAFSAASHRVVIYSRDDVRHGWRVIWGDRALRVLGVIDGGGRRIDLICEEEIL